MLEKAQIDDDILFDTITFEDLQAAGLPSLDARRVIARLEQLKAPSKSLEHSFPPLSNGKVAPPVKEEAGWSQVAKPVVPEAVVPEALPEEPPVIIEAPAPAPAPSPPEKRKKRPAKKKPEPAPSPSLRSRSRSLRSCHQRRFNSKRHGRGREGVAGERKFLEQRGQER